MTALAPLAELEESWTVAVAAGKYLEPWESLAGANSMQVQTCWLGNWHKARMYTELCRTVTCWPAKGLSSASLLEAVLFVGRQVPHC